MARMVALLVMVNLHHTQNRMSHCSVRLSTLVCREGLAGSEDAVIRQTGRFDVISLRLVTRAV